MFDAVGRTSTEMLVLMAAQLRGVPPGDVLKVVTDDPAARGDLEAWCRMTGNEIADVVKGRGYHSFYIRKNTS